MSFKLKHNEQIVLKVPFATGLTVTEVVPEGYTPEAIMMGNDNDPMEDGDAAEESFTVDCVTKDGTITITNAKGVPVQIVKTDQAGNALENAVISLSGDTISNVMELISKIPEGGSEAVIYTNDVLPVGTYTLTETVAPAGYILPEWPAVITVCSTENGIMVSATINGTEIDDPNVMKDPDSGIWTIKITNQVGYALPSTGGSGTNLIHLLGILLTGFAGMSLVMKRRRNAIRQTNS